MQIFEDGHSGKHTASFRHHGQAFLDQVPGAAPLDAFTQVLDVAAQHRQATGDCFHGGCLAGAVRADQRDQLAFTNLKINALDRLNAAIGYLQGSNF